MAEASTLDELAAKRRDKKGRPKKPPQPPAGGAESSDDPRPVIEIIPGKLPAIVDAAERALIDAGADIYQSGGRLLTIGYADPEGRRDKIQREPGAPRLIPVTPVHLREVLTEVAAWLRWDARSERMKPVDCPMAVAAALVDRGRWSLRELVAYVEAPTVRRDGSPIIAPGYDEASGLFLLPGAPAVTLPEAPTLDDAKDAAEYLAGALASWPYVEAADHAAAVAMVMGMLYARSVDAVPMACVTAPTPGTGKSLLVDAGGIIATGRRVAVVSLGRDPNEAGKRLAAGLLAGDSPLSADNVETPLGDEMLCQAVTQPWLSIRPLGSSNPVRVPSRTALCATGGNLVIRGDLTRRVMMVRIDANMERPETRRFEGDILTSLAADRAQLIGAALTITTAYQAVGCPPVDLDPIGGFEDWDRLVRRPLVWAGLSDPLAPAAETRAEDPDRAAMLALFTALVAVYKDDTVTAADMVDDGLTGAPRYDGDGFTHEHPDLHDALRQVCGQKIDARVLGFALRRYRGRIADGLRLDGIARHGPTKVTGWRVVQVENSASCPSHPMGDMGDMG